MKVWSFFWRFVVYGAALAQVATFATGFVMGLFGASHVEVRNVATVVQVVALLLAAVSAYMNAKNASPPATA